MKAKPNSLLDKVVNQLSSSSSPTNPTSTASTAISKYANYFTATAAQAVKSAAANANSSPMGVGTAGIAHSVATSNAGRSTPIPPHLSLMMPAGNAHHDGGLSSPVQSSPNPNAMPTGMKRTDSMRGIDRDSASMPAADGALTLAAAERMLRWHAEAVGRVVQLSQSDV
jgi:hypothetical protein